MRPSEAQKMYRDQLTDHGEVMTLRRPALQGGQQVDVDGHGRFREFDANDLVGSIVSAERTVVLLAEDFASFPLPIKPNSDRLIVAGRSYVIKSVNDTKARIAGVTVAYWLYVSGA